MTWPPAPGAGGAPGPRDAAVFAHAGGGFRGRDPVCLGREPTRAR